MAVTWYCHSVLEQDIVQSNQFVKEWNGGVGALLIIKHQENHFTVTPLISFAAIEGDV